MTQDELWNAKYEDVISFIQTNHRNPSRYVAEERGKYCNWLKHKRQLMNGGEMKELSLGMFTKLLSQIEQNKHVNQWK